MDIASIGSKIKLWIIRFRYPILVIVIGLILLSIPSKSKESTTQTLSHSQVQTVPDIAEQLTQILQQIQGVGKVRVMLTVSKGEKTEYQQNEDLMNSESDTSIRKETVIIRDTNDGEMALIIQVIPPEYLGAIVVCEGADNASVKLAVVEAVSKVTGLRSDHISVLKMK